MFGCSCFICKKEEKMRNLDLQKPMFEEKTILERIRKLELQVVELHQYLDVDKAKVDLLRDILRIKCCT